MLRKSAIVTGATGFVGGAVLKELLDAGYEVWAVVRDGKEDFVPKHLKCHVVTCDLAENKTA